jgi:hypothetical protein
MELEIGKSLAALVLPTVVPVRSTLDASQSSNVLRRNARSANDRYGSKTEVAALHRDVCFAPVSGHRQAVSVCPKSAISGALCILLNLLPHQRYHTHLPVAGERGRGGCIYQFVAHLFYLPDYRRAGPYFIPRDVDVMFDRLTVELVRPPICRH